MTTMMFFVKMMSAPVENCRRKLANSRGIPAKTRITEPPVHRPREACNDPIGW